MIKKQSVAEKILHKNNLAKETKKQKMAEERFADSEEKFRTLFEKASDALVYLDWKGRILNVNLKTEELTGLKKEDLIGKPFYNLGIVDKKIVPKLFLRLKDSFQGKQTFGYQMTIKRKNGSEKHIEINASVVRRKKAEVGLLAVVRDVTERKKVEVELQEKTRLSQILLDAFPCVTLLLRPSSRKIVAS